MSKMSKRTINIEVIPDHTQGYYSGLVYINNVKAATIHPFSGSRPEFEAFRAKMMAMSGSALLELIAREQNRLKQQMLNYERELRECETSLQLMNEAETAVQNESED